MITTAPARAALAGALTALLFASSAPAADRSQEIIVQRAPGVSVADTAGARDEANVRIIETNIIDHVDLVVAKDGDQDTAIRALNSDPTVLNAEPNHPVRGATTGQTTDLMFGSLWGITRIGAPAAWNITKGSGVTVAVVDSGVQLDHPDLTIAQNTGEIPGNGVDDDHDGFIDNMYGWDWVQGDNNPSDEHGHGTHVSGTISANENLIGVVGVAPQTTVTALRVLNANNSGWASDVAAAFNYAGEKGYKIVNASLSSGSYTTVEYQAIANHPNTLYVVAASNDSTDNDSIPRYPCNYSLANIICVEATQSDDALASYSNWGKTSVDLAAPGTGILSTIPTSTYASWNGTSMATPHVAGVAALLWSQNPSLTVAQVKQLILDNVEPLPGLTNLSVTGGILDAAAAVTAANDDPPPPPPPAKPTNLIATAGQNRIDLSWSPVSGADSYRIYRFVGAGPWTPLATLAGHTTSYTDLGLAHSTTYSYKVAAVNADNVEGAASDDVWATTFTAVSPPADSSGPASPGGGGGGGGGSRKPAETEETPAVPQPEAPPTPAASPAVVAAPQPANPAAPASPPAEEQIEAATITRNGVLALRGMIPGLREGRRVRVTLTAKVRGRRITRSVLIATSGGEFRARLRLPARMRAAKKIRVTVKAGKRSAARVIRR